MGRKNRCKSSSSDEENNATCVKSTEPINDSTGVLSRRLARQAKRDNKKNTKSTN